MNRRQFLAASAAITASAGLTKAASAYNHTGVQSTPTEQGEGSYNYPFLDLFEPIRIEGVHEPLFPLDFPVYEPFKAPSPGARLLYTNHHSGLVTIGVDTVYNEDFMHLSMENYGDYDRIENLWSRLNDDAAMLIAFVSRDGPTFIAANLQQTMRHWSKRNGGDIVLSDPALDILIREEDADKTRESLPHASISPMSRSQYRLFRKYYAANPRTEVAVAIRNKPHTLIRPYSEDFGIKWVQGEIGHQFVTHKPAYFSKTGFGCLNCRNLATIIY